MTNSTAQELSCQELVELVTDYLEGALPEGERSRFEEHVGGCGGCAAYIDQMRETIRLTGRLAADDFTPEAERTLLEAFRGWNRR